MSILEKIWKIKDEPDAEFRAQFLDLHPIILKLLYNRGLKTQEQITEFFNPDYSDLHDPFLFRDMKTAINRLIRAINSQEKIMIHGDYDADGVTSSALVINTLKLLGAKVEAFIPHREKDGYGLTRKTIEKFIEQGIDVLITVDCGSTNVDEVRLAVNAGIDVIITDHHEIPETVPPALAFLNPRQKDDPYPFEGLSGVGMAFKLMSALVDTYHGPIDFSSYGGRDGYKKWLLDIVAIGLVADIMPLLGENRILVTYGLLVLSKTRRLGLQKLAEVSNIDMKNADSFTIGYQIAPRINAAGRLSHAREAFELLTTNDRDEALKLALQLQEINTQRQRITDNSLTVAKTQAESQKDNPIIFVYHPDWPAGIIGLIAGRICEEYYKPVMAITRQNDQLVGSGRSVSYFNITQSLYVAEDLLARFGGHPQACGFTLAKPEYLTPFKQRIKKFAITELADKELTPVVEVETELTLNQVTMGLAKELEKFQPYGEANPKPQFLISKAQIVSVDFMGEDAKHLRLMIKQSDSLRTHKLIGFFIGQTWGQMLSPGDQIDVIVEMGINVWQGMESVELKIKELKIVNP